MLSLIQLHAAPLDSAAPALSLIHALLYLLMIAAIPMIPYLWMYLFLGDSSGTEESAEQPIRKINKWLHVHFHPPLLHHHQG